MPTASSFYIGLLGAFLLILAGIGASYFDLMSSFYFVAYSGCVLFATGVFMGAWELRLALRRNAELFQPNVQRIRQSWRQILREYVWYFIVMTLVLWLYRYIPEYGYPEGNYYKVWFYLFGYIYAWFVAVGLPAFFLMYYLFNLKPALISFSALRHHLPGFLVKFFFLPVMTVFFYDQFNHFVKNVSFLRSSADIFQDEDFLRHFMNISFTSLFLIDTGLAWCGYFFSFRWLDTHIRSVEPTMVGWVVALISYPPMRTIWGYYSRHPDEKDFLNHFGPWIATPLAVICVSLLAIYVLATISFGLRFSNLTHRGIITHGPYAYVRHPAYASKVTSWWIAMLPVVIVTTLDKDILALFFQIASLIMLTYVYYLRAITEERHLSQDEDYRAYCQKVRYRFFPKIY